jgi:hypothetical protein
VVDKCTRVSIADKVLGAFPSIFSQFIPSLDSIPKCYFYAGGKSENNAVLEKMIIANENSNLIIQEPEAVPNLNSEPEIDIEVQIESKYSSNVTVDSPDSFANQIKNLIESKTDPDDVEDWINANKATVYTFYELVKKYIFSFSI